jgi:hypothetical protein
MVANLGHDIADLDDERRVRFARGKRCRAWRPRGERANEDGCAEAASEINRRM